MRLESSVGIYDDCPCFGCEKPKRHYGCHSKCPDKARWDADKKELMDKINSEKQKDYTAGAVLAEGAAKARKKAAQRKRR